MDLQTKKIKFILKFFRINSEEIINKLDKLLHEEREKIFEKEIKSMSMQQYEQRIDKAYDDFKNNRVMTVEELKDNVAKWD